MKNRQVWLANRAYFDSNVTLKDPRVTFMRSFFNTGGPLEINNLYKLELNRRTRQMEKKYYQDVNLTMDPVEAKEKNWTLSNSTYIRFKNIKDRSQLQEEIVGNFAKKINEERLKMNEEMKEKNKKFKINYFNFKIFFDLFLLSLANDAYYALLSLAFVFLIMLCSLKSCCLSCCGSIIIVASFPVTVCITNGVLGVTYFGFLQTLLIFIVIGIAADDIFVFLDAWT